MLGGTLVDPERVNPYVDSSAARARQLATLAKMATLHMISTREATDAGSARLGLRPAGQPAGVAPDFSDRTAIELRAAYGERALYSSDLRVRTTIDLDLQTAVNATLAGLPPPAAGLWRLLLSILGTGVCEPWAMSEGGWGLRLPTGSWSPS